MRKITREATEAFFDEADYSKSNTIVETIRQPHMTTTHMYLHWNEIARFYKDEITLDACGWKTKITKERMNGILERLGLYVKAEKWVWYLCDYNWRKVEFDKVNYIRIYWWFWGDNCNIILYL